MADQLPPRAPSVAENRDDHNWLDNFVDKQPSAPTISLADHANNVNSIEHDHPSWVDEFMEFSATKRGAHRRSVSDSVAFIERVGATDDNQFAAHSAGNEDHGTLCGSTSIAGKSTSEFEKFDDEQFMSMFSDDHLGNCTEKAGDGVPPAAAAAVAGGTENSCSNPTSTSSDHNSTNELDKHTIKMMDHHRIVNDHRSTNDNEIESSSMLMDKDSQQSRTTTTCNNNTSSNTAATTPSSEPVMDPKRVKRILANRQSAQRSRVRKLHYISELERRVTTLQSEVSMLSPRVAFLDHQRMLLNVDNSTLKAKIAALAQDKIFKEAHQEALRREIERLRQVYYQQTLKKAAAGGNPAAAAVTINTPTSSSPTPTTAVAAPVTHLPPPCEVQFHEEQQQQQQLMN